MNFINSFFTGNSGDSGSDRYINEAPPARENEGYPRVCRMYSDDYQYILDNVLSHKSQETGGDLFGYYTRSGDPIVHLVVGPGKNARHYVTSFYQDKDFLEKSGAVAMSFGMTHLGNWHSHHRLGLAHPSGGDLNTVFHALRHHNVDHFLLCIANIDRYNKATLKAFWIDKTWEGRGNGEFAEMEIEVMSAPNPTWASLAQYMTREKFKNVQYRHLDQQRTQQQRPQVPPRIPARDPLAGHWTDTPQGKNFFRMLYTRIPFTSELQNSEGGRFMFLKATNEPTNIIIVIPISGTGYTDPMMTENFAELQQGRTYERLFSIIKEVRDATIFGDVNHQVQQQPMQQHQLQQDQRQMSDLLGPTVNLHPQQQHPFYNPAQDPMDHGTDGANIAIEGFLSQDPLFAQDNNNQLLKEDRPNTPLI
jgi:hypothetical protein